MTVSPVIWFVSVCVCVTSWRGPVDQLPEDPQQQVEDSGQDGHTSCTAISSQPIRHLLHPPAPHPLYSGVSPSGEQTDGSSERTDRTDDTSLQSLSVQDEGPAAEDQQHHQVNINIHKQKRNEGS